MPNAPTHKADRHVSTEQLLQFADGELSVRAAKKVRSHVEACWACRSQYEDVKSTIVGLVRYRDRLVGPCMPPPTSGRNAFLSRLDSLASQPHETAVMLLRRRLRAFLSAKGVSIAAGATAVALMVAALVLFFPKPAPVSAAMLLQRSSEVEHKLASTPGRVLHRELVLEERSHTSGQLLSRKRIETWQSNYVHCSARRVYNDQNHLVGGEWVNATGSRTVIAPSPPSRPNVNTPDSASAYSFNNIWTLSPSAEEFSALSRGKDVQVSQSDDAYLLQFNNQPRVAGVVQASLTINRATLRPMAENLEVEQQSEVRDYSIRETHVEQPLLAELTAQVFEPDASLLPPAPPSPKPAQPASSEKATLSPQLQLDIFNRLDQVEAFSGEQISVMRLPQGRMKIEGIVDSEQKKEELLASLTPVLGNPALEVDVATIAEVQARQAHKPQTKPTVRVDTIQIAEASMPVAADLRTYFTEHKQLDAKAADSEMHAFSDRITARSVRARLNAAALKQIVESFSESELAGMNETARVQWHGMINKHAEVLWQETEMMRQELQPIFRSGKPTLPLPVPTNPAELRAVTQRLFELAVANDQAVQESFSASTSPAPVAPVKKDDFWASLSEIEGLTTWVVGQQ